MSVWRPAAQIKVKALGLHWRHGKLLASRIYDDAGNLKGVRPLGGHVEFGETAQMAVIREFKEELNMSVIVIGAPIFLENIFKHHGVTGHEYCLLFDIQFPDGAFQGQSELTYYEDNGQACCAAWFNLADLDRPGGPTLFPAGLKGALEAR